MFECGENNNNGCSCYFHPKQVVVGVCCMCLNERLVFLASNQLHQLDSHHHTCNTKIKNNYKPLSKIFHFTHSFIHRFDFRLHQPSSPPSNNYYDTSDNQDDDTSTSSQQDSFISIKFEDNGAASWEKNNLSKEYMKNDSKDFLKGSTSVIKHAKSRGSSLRWRKWIGYFYQIIRWKRSSQRNVGHKAAKFKGVKVRTGWMRSLTKRRTK